MTRLLLLMLLTALPLHAINLAYANDSSATGEAPATMAHWESATTAYRALEQFSGQWRGVGEGKWGISSAEKRFSAILDGKAICRGGSSVYPVQERNPDGELHKAHSLFTLTEGGDALSLTEFDNEGFIARYRLNLDLSLANKTWVFELVSGDNLPPNFRARLTLHAPENGQYMEIFELNFGNKGYATYLTNRLTRLAVTDVVRGCLPD